MCIGVQTRVSSRISWVGRIGSMARFRPRAERPGNFARIRAGSFRSPPRQAFQVPPRFARPESVEISSGAPATGAMPGRVADVVTLGAFRHVVLDLASGDRIISACPNRPDIAFTRGQEISVSIPPRHAFSLRDKLALMWRSLHCARAKGHQLPEGHGSSNIHLRAERPSALERHKVRNAASDA